MIIRPGTASDFATVTAWLHAAGLPTADLEETHMQNFLVAVAGEAPVGMVGLEEFTDIGLLRSLVVDPEARSAGIGRQLVAALEANAVSKGIMELWLLTIDADDYFAKLGYETTTRDVAPLSIRNTQEFSGLCPGDATLMKKVL
jgi:amino-acid N-acetyltransferase